MANVRLIDANALLQEVDSLTTLIGNPKFDTKRYWHTTGFNGGIVAAKRSVKDAPTVDAVEVVHARWVKNGWNDYSCSACNCQLIGHGASGWNYCPNCGAKMDGERKDNGKSTSTE